MSANLSLSGLLFACSPLAAVEPGPREMSTDRPDTTESPYTVPAGMVQIEASFFDFTRDGGGEGPTDEWVYGQIDFKLGLTPQSDLQVVVNSHTAVGETGTGERNGRSGLGDITLRYKHNLWGNDGGDSAFALMPSITMPTGTEVSGDGWSGGLMAPLGIALTDRLSLGLMGQFDLVHDGETGGHDLECLHSMTLGLSVTDWLGVYGELVGIAGQDADYQALFDTGLTFSLSDDLVLDAGVRLGLNRAAPDFGVFTGLSIRF